MTGLVLAALLVQAQAPDISATVDRGTVAVAEEVLLTIRATTRSDLPLRVQVPSLDGFELISRSERTEVAFDPDPRRSTVIQIRLRSTRVGIFALSDIHALQGPHRVVASPVTIEVIDAKGAVAAALNPRVARLLARGPPRNLNGEVGLVVLLSSKRVSVGEQVDVVTAAWIPRELRLRLRRPPTLEPATVEGMWTYPQPTPVGIAASRMVNGVWYDLFVTHEVVFPLAPGEHLIDPATLRYSVPLALQFFSQEERLSLTSEPAVVTATPLPDGAPADFNGTVGRSLRLARTVTPGTGRAGEPLSVDVTLAGEGNIALWSEPPVQWPPEVRTYPDQTEERIQPVDGRIAGTKRFRFSVIPDSAGTMVLPPMEYSYYDPRARVYRQLRAPGVSVAVAPPGPETTAKALPPPLLFGTRSPVALRLVRALPAWGWVTLLLLPVLVAGGGLIPWARLKRPAPSEAPPRERVVEAELTATLKRLVPDADEREADDLLDALHMGGIPPEAARRLVEARARLRTARYGGGGRGRGRGLGTDDPGLSAVLAEVQDLLAEVGAPVRPNPAAPPDRRRWGRRSTAAAGLLLVLGTPLMGQTPSTAPSPEAAYEVGSLSRAAEGFQQRVVLAPHVPAHWYNLGASYYRLGEETRAQWAWNMAARLAPRNMRIRRALQLVPPPDNTSATLLRVPLITRDELLVLAGLLWVLGWGGIIVKPVLVRRWAIVLGIALMMGGAALGVERTLRRPIALVLRKTPLRVSPHERAPHIGSAESGAAVELQSANRGWRLVRAPSNQDGWMRSDAFVVLRWIPGRKPSQ